MTLMTENASLSVKGKKAFSYYVFFLDIIAITLTRDTKRNE